MVSLPEVWFTDITSSFDPPLIILGDFNINILHNFSSLSPRLRQLLDWINKQDLYLLNIDIPTRSGTCGCTSLLDLTLLTPALHNKIRYYVHPDLFDSNHHPIILLSPSPVATLHAPFLPRWSAAATAFNKTQALQLPSYQEFADLCTNIISDTSALVKFRSRQCCPWWDDTCSYLLRIKHKSLRHAGSRYDWLTYKKKCCQASAVYQICSPQVLGQPKQY